MPISKATSSSNSRSPATVAAARSTGGSSSGGASGDKRSPTHHAPPHIFRHRIDLGASVGDVVAQNNATCFYAAPATSSSESAAAPLTSATLIKHSSVPFPRQHPSKGISARIGVSSDGASPRIFSVSEHSDRSTAVFRLDHDSENNSDMIQLEHTLTGGHRKGHVLNVDFAEFRSSSSNRSSAAAAASAAASSEQEVTTTTTTTTTKSLLVTCGQDKNASLWDLTDETAPRLVGVFSEDQTSTSTTHSDSVLWAVFSAGGDMLATCAANEVRLWKTATLRPLGPDGGIEEVFRLIGAVVQVIVWMPLSPSSSSSPHRIAVGDSNGKVSFLTVDPASGKAHFEREHIKAHSESIAYAGLAVRRSPRDPAAALLVTGSRDLTIKIFTVSLDSLEHSLVHTLTGHTEMIRKICFTSDAANVLLSCGRDGMIICWGVETGKVIASASESSVYDIAVVPRGRFSSPDATTLFAVSTDKSGFAMYTLTTGTPTARTRTTSHVESLSLTQTTVKSKSLFVDEEDKKEVECVAVEVLAADSSRKVLPLTGVDLAVLQTQQQQQEEEELEITSPKNEQQQEQQQQKEQPRDDDDSQPPSRNTSNVLSDEDFESVDAFLAKLPKQFVFSSEDIAIERELGRGGMGSVFAGRLKSAFGVPCAIKVFSARDSWSIKKQMLEIYHSLRLGLGHKNIVRTLGVAKARSFVGDDLLLMLDLADGSLAEWMHSHWCAGQQNSSNLSLALAFFRHIAEALAFLHLRGTLWLDAKPENVLLFGNRACVADFGISHFSNLSCTDAPNLCSIVASNTTNLTSGSAGCATLRYAPPEQRGHSEGSSLVRRQNDTFAFGAMLVYLLTGVQPYGDRSITDILGVNLCDLFEQRTPPILPIFEEESNRQLKEKLVSLCKQCLQLDPHARPKDGVALLRALLGDEEPLPREIQQQLDEIERMRASSGSMDAMSSGGEQNNGDSEDQAATVASAIARARAAAEGIELPEKTEVVAGISMTGMTGF